MANQNKPISYRSSFTTRTQNSSSEMYSSSELTQVKRIETEYEHRRYKSESQYTTLRKSSNQHQISYSPIYRSTYLEDKKINEKKTETARQQFLNSRISINQHQPQYPSTFCKDKNKILPSKQTVQKLNLSETEKKKLEYCSPFASAIKPSIQPPKKENSINKPELILCESSEKSSSEKLLPAVYYIFNFKNFNNKDKKLIDRETSDLDVKIMKETLDEYKLKGKIYVNLKLQKLKKKMTKISKKNFTKNSAIVITIMSHGEEENKIHATDGEFSLHKDIIGPLDKNESLNGKPKIIFCEACRGLDTRFQARDGITNSKHELLIAYATFEGTTSLSHQKTGSYFIQSLCKKLKEFGGKKYIVTICDDVMDDVKKNTNYNQNPSIYRCLNSTNQKYCLGDYL